MFMTSQGGGVNKDFVSIARDIADSAVEDMPQYSWASVVLCAMYRGLCDATFRIGRPVVDTSSYEYPAGIDPVDRPTMGTSWVRRRCHAPQDLSSLCTRDTVYWLTRCWLVFDVHIEEYVIHQVLRQFGLCQIVHVPYLPRLHHNVHSVKDLATQIYAGSRGREFQPTHYGWLAWPRGWRCGRHHSRTYMSRSSHTTLPPTRLTSSGEQVEAPVTDTYPTHVDAAWHEVGDIMCDVQGHYLLFGQHIPQFEEDFAHTDVEDSDR
ncbi:hypothetical protein E2562_031818 [Oryza meyeriana var. granulata]|uniref:Aminotransferase-like plant mobile domain-containing protein n=1 Tax=Oryza meyeriana var. granulata TaxID=110450 RepID=A0A6G1ECL0_9ORYZ|nr:hypothetical protein E2562_031818 [Oryza meyeriana var. granulata]